MANRLSSLFESGRNGLLSVYYTAGFPAISDTIPVAKALEEYGADLLEIGIPFSDPIADGPTIQASNDVALANGMNIGFLFDQIKDLRNEVKIPVLLMGYFNPVYQFGVEKFCQNCQGVGIDGLIIPDMPLWEYETKWKAIFEKYNLFNIFLITPYTPKERILAIDGLSSSFIYMVSSASVTGTKISISEDQIGYFDRIKKMNLKSPALIGFGMSNRESFLNACNFSRGAIIGSAFIEILKKLDSQISTDRFLPIKQFIKAIKG